MNDQQAAPAAASMFPGRLVAVGETRYHVQEMGSGPAVVIFEAAIMDFSPTWALVLPGVAEFARALAYDRAGLGWSDPGRGPRTAGAVVAELRSLLAAAGDSGPFILVGHSFASLPVRLFAYRHPAEVAGIVLVDGAHEDQFERFPEPVRQMFGPMWEGQLGMMAQIRDAVAAGQGENLPPLVPVSAAFPEDVASAYRRQAIADGTRIATMMAELAAMEASQDEVRAARGVGLGDIPLAVLSHGAAQPVPGLPDDVNAAYEAEWQRMQDELAAQSTRGWRDVIDGAGHMIHHDRPDAVVTAIQRILTERR